MKREKEATMMIRLPAALKKQIEAAAEASDRSASGYMLHAAKIAMGLRPVEVCLSVRLKPSGDLP